MAEDQAEKDLPIKPALPCKSGTATTEGKAAAVATTVEGAAVTYEVTNSVFVLVCSCCLFAADGMVVYLVTVTIEGRLPLWNGPLGLAEGLLGNGGLAFEGLVVGPEEGMPEEGRVMVGRSVESSLLALRLVLELLMAGGVADEGV